MNVTLHQSLINTSTIGFANLDISNSFSEPFPNFNGYGTSFINTTIKNIYAQNKNVATQVQTGDQEESNPDTEEKLIGPNHNDFDDKYPKDEDKIEDPTADDADNLEENTTGGIAVPAMPVGKVKKKINYYPELTHEAQELVEKIEKLTRQKVILEYKD